MASASSRGRGEAESGAQADGRRRVAEQVRETACHCAGWSGRYRAAPAAAPTAMYRVFEGKRKRAASGFARRRLGQGGTGRRGRPQERPGCRRRGGRPGVPPAAPVRLPAPPPPSRAAAARQAEGSGAPRSPASTALPPPGSVLLLEVVGRLPQHRDGDGPQATSSAAARSRTAADSSSRGRTRAPPQVVRRRRPALPRVRKKKPDQRRAVGGQAGGPAPSARRRVRRGRPGRRARGGVATREATRSQREMRSGTLSVCEGWASRRALRRPRLHFTRTPRPVQRNRQCDRPGRYKTRGRRPRLELPDRRGLRAWTVRSQSP